MASTYSNLLRIELLATGENRGTWGTKTNSNLSTIVEQAIAGISTVLMLFDADYTLTTNNGSDDEARKAILNITSIATLSQTRNVIIPAVSKVYVIKNATTGSQNITIKTASGTGVTIQYGCTKTVYCDGTNVFLTDNGNKDYPLLVGSIVSSNSTRFPNTQVVISNTAVSIQKNETHNIGLLAEGVAHPSNANIYGIGVYGVGYTSATTRSGGVVGEGHVSATTDVGSAIGVRGYANDTHAGGYNIGLYGDASGGSSNYALYMNSGDIYTANNQTWNLNNKTLTISGDVVFSSNITVNGVQTTVNSVTMTVDDNNIELNSITSPTDATANGGGITLKGTADKTLSWVGGTSNSWTSSENVNLNLGKEYRIGGNTVFNANTIGSGNIDLSIKSKTLTISNTVNLLSGTANGVAYLNGSKAVTTGSALTFDGTKLNVVSNGEVIRLSGSSPYINYYNAAGTTQYGYIQHTGTDLALVNVQNGSIPFYTNNTEQMRLTSTGLGIGTTTPGTKLQINANNAEIRLSEVGTYYGSIKVDSAGGLTIGADPSNVAASSRLIFGVDGTEQMRLDSSGNLGLGVTPSGWGSIFRVMQLGNAYSYVAGRADGARQVWLGSNNYYNGTSWIYGLSQAASQYQQDAGAHYWYTAPSGTAGSAISFTQAMTLDASGNLLVGTTTNTNSSKIVSSGTISETVNSIQYNVVSQADIGTAANKIPLNQYLGSMAYQNSTNINIGSALVGSTASQTRFPNTQVAISSVASTIQQNESHNIGLLAEGVANSLNTSIYGVGLYGVGYTASATRCGGVIGEGHVSATGDTGSAIGVRGYANDTHSGGLNIGVLGEASGSSIGNYGFYSNIASSAGINYNLYIPGTADNYVNGNVYLGTGNLWVPSPAPTSLSAVTTLTAAQLQTDIINTTGTTYTVTLPTGAAIDAGFTGVPTTNIGFDFHIVNTASGTITIAVGASGMTSVGSLTIATGTSAAFRLRRSAAATYVLYRLV